MSRRTRNTSPHINRKKRFIFRLSVGFTVLAIFSAHRSFADLKLSDLSPQDNVSRHQATGASRGPASIPSRPQPKSAVMKIVRPGMGQGEHMLYTSGPKDQRTFYNPARNTGGALKMQVVGVCRSNTGLVYQNNEQGYASCIEGRTGTISDIAGSGGRGAGVGFLIR